MTAYIQDSKVINNFPSKIRRSQVALISLSYVVCPSNINAPTLTGTPSYSRGGVI